MTTVPAAAQAAPADRRRWILIATIIGSSMTFVDGTVVNIALPTIGRDLGAGLSAQQWVMLSYSLAVASLYIVSGALGDRYGRWTLFVCGVAGFACASALAGLAPNTGLLIAGRVLQGVAGAILIPGSLALLTANFEGEAQGRAFGFDGKTLIHPGQIEICNRVFAPSAKELAQARRVLEAFAGNPGKGAIALDGHMIEGLHAEEARRLLALAKAIEGRA